LRRDARIPGPGEGGVRRFWSAYLDDFDEADFGGLAELEARTHQVGKWQQAVRSAYQQWGIPRGEGKEICSSFVAERLGARLDGREGRVTGTTRKLFDLLSLLLYASAAAPFNSPSPLERAVPRDLFPLPRLPPVLGEKGSRSRQVLQKVGRSRAATSAADETLWALNELAGRGHSFDGLGPSEGQASAVTHVLAACREDRPWPALPAPEAALRELLDSKASNYVGDGLCSVAPFCRDSVSWPS
jgi:hypothetical protein